MTPPPPPDLTKSGRRARTPQWWDRPLGALLLVVALALAVLIVATADGRAANLSKHVLGAALVLAILGTFGMGFLLPKHAVRFLGVVFGLVCASFIWVGVEHFLDWHEFYRPGGSRTSVRSEGGARVEGGFLMVLGLLGILLWITVFRGLRKRGAGTGP